MYVFNVLTLAGGLAMFLYGMRIMGDGLASGSSGALKSAMEKVTNNPIKAFLLGLLITAVIQSSTATIVITSGLVAAGILTLHQSLGIVIGANVGTTMTGQILRLLDLDSSTTSWVAIFKPSTLAPIALVLGIVLIMGSRGRRGQTVGKIAMGFGILFTGLITMTDAVSTLQDSGIFESLLSGLGNNHVLGYLTGAGIAFILQSSSATIGILQAFSQAGIMTFSGVYAVIVGIYLGDCLTTFIVCSIGAKADQKRVGMVNILFNLSETVLVLTVVAIIHRLGLIDGLWNTVVDSSIIANTNTTFNLTCAIVLLPMVPVYEKLSRKIIKDDPAPGNKYKEKLDELNPALFNSPALALNSCYDLLKTTLSLSRQNLDRAFRLLTYFDQKTMDEIDGDEASVDLMTDATSKYLVSLLPHVKGEENLAIVNQYYRDVTEFERLGDDAVNIAKTAENMQSLGIGLSVRAAAELEVMEDLLRTIADSAQQAFEKRDVTAAYRVLPLEAVAEDLIDALKENHLRRMSMGECNVLMDSHFMDLLYNIKRSTGICSNIATATIIRVQPELANQRHEYFVSLRSGKDETFNAEYNRAHEDYFQRLAAVNESEKAIGIKQ